MEDDHFLSVNKKSHYEKNFKVIPKQILNKIARILENIYKFR